ncbi:MAG: TonB family protein [Acidobacteria bacterium]|nr:TonB family protein [Acidobacteriota bacterium]
MSAKPALPRLFGPYVLTKFLHADALGEVYRAGTAAGKNMRPFLLIRIFNGESIDREALFPAMETAVDYIEEVKGPAVAKGAVLGVVDDTPFAGIEYVPGRTLDKLLTPPGQDPVALPPEHALLITEKILIALEASKAIAKGTGAPHGFLAPAFVSVSNDGDVRVYGAGLGNGLVPSLKNEKARVPYAPYMAPEVLASGKSSAPGDIFSAAAILFECLTGKPPAAGLALETLATSVLAVNGNPIPDDIKRLLSRGLANDPAQRAGDVVAYRKELGKLLYGGPYAPSTFNLAFFMHHQFEKSIEQERKELAHEEEYDPKPLLAAEEAAAKAPARPKVAPRDITLPSFGVSSETGAQTLGGSPVPKKGGLPIPLIVAAAVVVVGGGFAFLTLKKKPEPPKPVDTAAAATPIPAATATPAPPPTPVILGKEDPAFQAALQAELAKAEKEIQGKIAKEQDLAEKKRQADLTKAAELAAKTREAEDAVKAARDTADQEEAKRLAREAQDARMREEAAKKAAEAALPKTKDGDFVEISQVDRPPSPTKIVKPEPPAMARQRKISGTVILTVTVDENGKPASIDITRDTSPKVGLGEASKRAVQEWEWTPALKDGKRVKTTVAVPIPFKL